MKTTSRMKQNPTANEKNKFKPFLLLPIILCSAFVFSFLTITLFLPNTLQKTISENFLLSSVSKPLVIIDAGHGGSDPGKIGITKTLEKEINLEIAFYLKELLENQDIQVILTREKDEALSQGFETGKLSDMKERINIIQRNHPDTVISIHQNSYSDPEILGAQCFYYADSIPGKTLASYIQEQIISSTKQTKIREIKPNSDYYLLKHSASPTIIVECGFLSNPTEEQLLSDKEYQRNMAWAIHLGVLKYLNACKQ